MSREPETRDPACGGCAGDCAGSCAGCGEGQTAPQRKPGRVPWLMLVLLVMLGAALLFAQLIPGGTAKTEGLPGQEQGGEATMSPDTDNQTPLYQVKSQEELQRDLSPLAYAVTQEAATEPAFRNAYHDNYQPGIYVDVTSGEPLFLSTDKFESGCGWPAFSKPIDSALIREKKDRSYGMVRTEVRSALSDAHLGHVFNDGPQELGGLRYCINSASLRFIPEAEMAQAGYGYLLDLIP